MGWTHRPLEARQDGRLSVVSGRYDPDTHRLEDPTHRPVSVPEAVALAPAVAERLAAEDARWQRTDPLPRWPDLLRPAVLPGPGTLSGLLERLGPDRPELLLTLTAVHRRHPEIVRAAGGAVRDRVTAAIDGLEGERLARHAAEAAGAAWTLLGERDRATELLRAWTPPAGEPGGAHLMGAEALALPDELVLGRVAEMDPGSADARALLKRHLLDPLAADVDLEGAIPLPAAFLDGLPRADLRPGTGAVDALLAQFDGWPAAGGARLALHAAAGVDRMPGPAPRPPDPRGVRAALHVVCGAREPQPLHLGPPAVAWGSGPQRPGAIGTAVPTELPARSALTIDLGALDDTVLEPGAAWAVTLPVRVGAEEIRLEAAGTVGVSW